MTQPNPAQPRQGTGSAQPGIRGPRARPLAARDDARPAAGPLGAGTAFAASAVEDTAVTAPAQTLPTGSAASGGSPTAGAGTRPAPPAPPRRTGPATDPGTTTGGRPRARARGPRRARLQLRHVNPWTVLKFSCVLAVALFFVWMIIIGVLFGILDATGVIGKINDAVTTINGSGSNAPVTAGIVFGSAAIIGAVNIVLFVALSTVGSVVYNLCADLVGGVEVTLSERGD